MPCAGAPRGARAVAMAEVSGRGPRSSRSSAQERVTGRWKNGRCRAGSGCRTGSAPPRPAAAKPSGSANPNAANNAHGARAKPRANGHRSPLPPAHSPSPGAPRAHVPDPLVPTATRNCPYCDRPVTMVALPATAGAARPTITRPGSEAIGLRHGRPGQSQQAHARRGVLLRGQMHGNVVVRDPLGRQPRAHPMRMAPIGIGTRRTKDGQHLRIAPAVGHCPPQRHVAPPIDGIHLGSRLQDQDGNLGAAGPGCAMRRPPACRIHAVRITAGLQCDPHAVASPATAARCTAGRPVRSTPPPSPIGP